MASITLKHPKQNLKRRKRPRNATQNAPEPRSSLHLAGAEPVAHGAYSPAGVVLRDLEPPHRPHGPPRGVHGEAQRDRPRHPGTRSPGKWKGVF